MNKKGCLYFGGFFFVFVFLCFCIFSLVVVSLGSKTGLTEEGTIESVSEEGDTNEKIAVIDLEGVIIGDSSGLNMEDDMVERIIKKLEKVQEDNSYRGVILRINTPGGTVYDSDKIAKEVLQTKEAGKMVVALMEESATSGGYYVAVTADKIVASEVTTTGSIGVVTQILDLEGLYNKLGVEVITVTNTQGDVKTFENIDDPNSKDRKVLEQVLNDNFDAFINIIDENRDLTKSEILALADGSIYSGKKAKELKLIDELGGIDKAIEIISEAKGLADPQIVELTDPKDIFSDFFGPSFMNSFKLVDDINGKINTDPGVYTWYIVSP